MLIKWVERNKAALHLLEAILYGLSSCQKVKLIPPPTPLYTPVARAFYNQTNIVCIKALMGLLIQDWENS